MWSSGQLQVHCQPLCGAIIGVKIRSLSWIGVSTLVNTIGRAIVWRKPSLASFLRILHLYSNPKIRHDNPCDLHLFSGWDVSWSDPTSTNDCGARSAHNKTMYLKVHVPDWMPHLERTPMFERWMVGYGFKNGHQKDMCWKEIELRADN